MRRRFSRWSPLGAVFAIGLACAAPDDGTRAETPPSGDQALVIEHLAPRRDSVGAVPTHFEWTKIEKADHYTISLWNDVDLMVWRLQNVPLTRVEWPKGEPLEPGTYFWAVSAFSGDRPIADSGRAAFVVRTAE